MSSPALTISHANDFDVVQRTLPMGEKTATLSASSLRLNITYVLSRENDNHLPIISSPPVGNMNRPVISENDCRRNCVTEISTADHEDCSSVDIPTWRVDVALLGEGPHAVGRLTKTWNGAISGSAVVVKVVKNTTRKNALNEAGLLSRLLRWTHLKHENILSSLGIDVVNSSLTLVVPRLKNGNILAYLEDNPFHDRLKSITEISAGLAYLHSLNPPLLHGNLKGRNVVVADDGHCRLVDFGLSVTSSLSDCSPNSKPIVSTFIQGSVRWLAPEVLLTNTSDIPRDLFSYALTIIEMMTGQDPFFDLLHEPAVAVAIARGKRPARPLHPKEGWCPDNIWDLVERCWAQDPRDRPKAVEVHAYLEGLVTISNSVSDGSIRAVDVPFFTPNRSLDRGEVSALPSSLVPRIRRKSPTRYRAASRLELPKETYLPYEVYSNLYKLAQRELEDDVYREEALSEELTSLLSLNEDTLRPGATYGIIQCHRYREKLYEVLHSTPMINAAEIFSAVSRDEERVAELIEIVLTSKYEMADALMLSEDDSECFMSALQDILDNTESSFISRLRERIRCLLVTLCKKSTNLPQSMFIIGVAPVQHRNANICGGAFGDVFRSTYQGKHVALKRLRVFRSSEQGKMYKKFCKEALLWKRLKHRFVLPLMGIDADSFPRQPCMVSPWMFNGTASEFLKRRPKADVDRLLYEVAQGIEYLHSEGIVHGDIKGANIMIDDESHPRLTDFGLTVLHDAQHNTTDHGGTLRWMAPELFFGPNSSRTFASDMYAFGCVCVELYTGRPPFADVAHDLHVLTKVYGGERPARPPRMSEDLWLLVNRCWNRHNEERPSARDVCHELERVVRERDQEFR
ncbi:hypothetical protein PM082_016507 [Marasmius tenuissimus]|nr:hypothetical protein PM082_016507 [Marasmius tenuissimus]